MMNTHHTLLRLVPRPSPIEPRVQPIPDDGLTLGDLHVNVRAREVTLAGERVPITRKELDLLAFFLTHPRCVYTRIEILTEVWNNDAGAQRTVDTHVRRLRVKLRGLPQLETVHGIGYVLRP